MADPAPPTDTPAQPPVPKPRGVWGAVLTATPVALTALATAFAGLSSSEMTQAMYHRSLAAQHQSRAGDQWAFFQAKRIRGTGLEASNELLQALGHPDPFDPARADADLARMSELLNAAGEKAGPEVAAAAAAAQRAREKVARLAAGEAGARNLSYLTGSALPTIEPRSLPDPAAREAYEAATKAVARRQTEVETAGLAGKLDPATIEEALRLAEDDADRFDQACAPTTELVQQLKAVFRELAAAVRPLRGAAGRPAEAAALFDRLDQGLRAAVMDYEARRYRQEAAFNRRAAEAYEVRVRRSGVESDRHRKRSERFFYSMLLAQVGVTVSSLALARAQRSWLWLVAAAAGLVSLAFTGYVYLSY